MEIHQILPNITLGDAIGNETLLMREILREWGYKSDIYAQHIDPRIDAFHYLNYKRISSHTNVLIYHYSIGSDISDFIITLSDTIVILYHNMTPDKYFKEVNNQVADLLHKGRIELNKFANVAQLGIGDSEFNCLELKEAGFTDTDVLPLILNFDKYYSKNEEILSRFNDDWINLIFVGRIAPNKCQDDIIKIFDNFKKFHPNSRLFLIGNYEGFEEYYQKLNDLVLSLSLQDVFILGKLDDPDLNSYYSLADVFICMSEHEGFCIPLIEAMYFNVPIIAYNSTAVPYTLGKSGILVNKKNHSEIASLINIIISNSSLKNRLIVTQQKRLKEFTYEKTKIKFKQIIDEIIINEKKNIKISDSLTPFQIEEICLKNNCQANFFNIDYVADWQKNHASAEDMAQYIITTMNPDTVLEVGCGVGKLVKELRNKNIDAYGVENSEKCVRESSIRNFIIQGNIFQLDFIGSETYDVVICLGILEHLPSRVLSNSINNLKRICKKSLLLAISSYGPNEFGFSGLPLCEECWIEDARKNRLFSHLLINKQGIPHLGHISLGTYRWWTQKFLKNGLIRDVHNENQGYHFINKYNMNIYALKKLDEDYIKIQDNNFFFEGIYPLEDWGEGVGKVRWTEKSFTIFLIFSKPINEIFIEFFSGLKEYIFERELKIICKILFENEGQQLEYHERFCKIYPMLPDTWYKFNIPLEARPNDVFKFECEVNDHIIPDYLLRNCDLRRLGIVLKAFGAIS